MRRYFLKRLLLAIPTLFGISILSFIIIHLAPGDPAEFGMMDTRAANPALYQQIIQETRALYGLDQPLYVQYGQWLKRMLTFDFGVSLHDHQPIIEKLKQRVPITVGLGMLSLALAFLLAIPIGVFSATHQHSRSDRIITVTLFMLYSLPVFWTATMAIVYLGGGDFWNVFPVFGLHSPGSETWSVWRRFQDLLWHLILPVICMSYYLTAVLSRYMRGAMLEVIRQDFIRTARAKGLSERTVIFRHALRNSLIPMVTMLADVLPIAISGSVVIETLFSIPGLGFLMFEAVFQRDYPVIMALFTITALITLGGILLADLLYTFVDPRIDYARQAA